MNESNEDNTGLQSEMQCESRTRGLRPWKPGVSGNPLGRRKGSASLTAAVKRHLNRAEAESLAAKIIALAKSGDPTVIRLLWEWIDGVARQSVDLSVGLSATPKANETPSAFYARLRGEIETIVARTFPGWEPSVENEKTVVIRYLSMPTLTESREDYRKPLYEQSDRQVEENYRADGSRLDPNQNAEPGVARILLAGRDAPGLV